ncbi:isochorismate synthase [Nocardioides albertanoniae]|uniref:isochorismate synthase n=1 Tax=Nocardioides albertanoniae TaxID=1175486 RepID=A0A543ADE7_9ACTN|nr:isochorismate synthase [Nocardioides albertanoniae]TQL70614.1 isochorismate synthase [Nocardioides albertanoniae]
MSQLPTTSSLRSGGHGDPEKSESEQRALVATTVALDAGSETLDDLLALLPARRRVLSWVRHGEGLVGWGTAAQIRTSGPERFAHATKWFDELAAASTVSDEVEVPGSGLIGFGSFAFADLPGYSVFTVPSVVVGRRGDAAWVTTIGPAASPPPVLAPTAPPESPRDVVFADAYVDGEHWMRIVADAVSRLQAGDLDKVVLARDLLAAADAPIDIRAVLRRLADTYPTCWTFHVDDLFGATPELLVRRERGLVTSRVLAGTIWPTGEDADPQRSSDLALAASLSESSKNLEEHEYAARSVADALEPHCSSMNVPEAPFVLKLPNVMHLATDITGVASDGVSSLDLAAALHPSAAVGGTPREQAVDLIAEIESMERARYAGPVGWMDATGDGEWGIALRSAEMIDDHTARLFAGCGIVAGSDPETELAETQAKFVPIRDALS